MFSYFIKRDFSYFIGCIFLGLVIINLPACADMHKIEKAKQIYNAYGKNWKYSTIEQYTKSWGFNTPHGILGMKEKLEQFVYLETSEGEKIPVHKRIYALQKDGSYKKVECCKNVLTQVNVYNFDKKLILYFEQKRSNVTDCHVYPSGVPDADKERDPMKRQEYVTFFGELDPDAGIFYVHEFLPGFTHKEFMKEVGYHANIKKTREFYYRKRREFLCNA